MEHMSVIHVQCMYLYMYIYVPVATVKYPGFGTNSNSMGNNIYTMYAGPCKILHTCRLTRLHEV